ncbi:MAG: hypothetical protein MAG451_01949 [Anaerolineales bacterium]|nr:hypothetical protein [Anaerolineales bacterium]
MHGVDAKLFQVVDFVSQDEEIAFVALPKAVRVGNVEVTLFVPVQRAFISNGGVGKVWF